MPSAIQTLGWRGFGFDCSTQKGERFCELRLGPIGFALMQQPVMAAFAAERARCAELAAENERLCEENGRLRSAIAGVVNGRRGALA